MIEIKTNSSHINIYISFFWGKKKISLKKLGKSSFYKSLNEYKYVLDNLPNVETSDKYRDVIWILWFQGEENAPEIVKKCIESVRYFNSDKQIIVLDLNTLKDYIEIPDYIQEKYSKGIIPHANFSDYVRLCLLVKYGGTWIDSTVLLTDYLPKEIMTSKFFMVKNNNCFPNIDESKFDIFPKKKKFRIFPKHIKKSNNKGFANWFIHSESNNRLLLAVLYFLEEYWKKENELKNYFIFHSFVAYCYNNDLECKKILDDMFSVPHRYTFLMQEFGKTQYNDKTFNKIIEMSCIHKLTYRGIDKQDDMWVNKVLNLNFDETRGFFKEFEI